MTNVSRPLQIVLAAFVLLIAVWFVALRDHTSATSGEGSNASVSQPTRPAAQAATRHATTVRATTVHKATGHTTAATTTAHTITTGHTTVVHRSTVRATAVHTTANHTTVVHATVRHSTVVKPLAKAKPTSVTKPASPAAKGKSIAGPSSAQVAVEHELRQGKTVLILFWNPHGYEDTVVHRELPAVQRAQHGAVVVRYASAAQVGEYGAITHAIQVNQTPTLLIVDPHGQTTTVTGLTDAFAIEQAISEARHPRS